MRSGHLAARAEKLAKIQQKHADVQEADKDGLKSLRECEQTALCNAVEALKVGIARLKDIERTARREIEAISISSHQRQG